MRLRVWMLVGVTGTALAVAAGLVTGRAKWPTPKVEARPTADNQHPFGTVDRGVHRVVLGGRSVPRYDIGGMKQGSRREVPFVVSNPDLTAVTIGAIRVSCDCFRVELDATRVEAGAEIGGRAIIDLAHEPGFGGGLTLDAVSVDDGRQVFALKLFVAVK